MALWFSLESECLLSAIFQLLSEKWAIIIRKHCSFSRLASSFWEGVYRQYIEKKCDETQLVQISTWCKSAHLFTSLQAPSFLASYTTEISSLLCRIPPCAGCVHMCYGAVIANIFACRWPWTEKQLQAICAFVGGEARSEHKCWSSIQKFILQDNIVL